MKDMSVITCNLCERKSFCIIKSSLCNSLNKCADTGILHRDFDDILVDLAVICNHFKEED